MPHLELSDGVPLYFEDHGDGEPLVLVPGWTITTRFWERQVADLARDHRVVTLDLRGAGNSGKTPDGHSLAGYASDLDELLRHLDLRDVTLVAWAMGVSVSLSYLVGQSFESDGEVYDYHDGMVGRAEVRVRAERILVAIVPGLKKL